MSPLMREIEHHIGAFGRDRLINQPMSNLESVGYGEGKVGSFMHKANVALEYASRATSDISGMALVNQSLQILAVRSSAANFTEQALKMAKGTVSEANKAKMLKLFGGDEEILNRVVRQLEKNAEFEPSSLSNRKLRVMNLEKWDDADALQAFREALHTDVYRVIQKNFAGELPLFMSREMGRTAFQFRTFMLGAYEKQLLSGLNSLDPATFQSWAYSMMFGGMAYTIQTYANSIGREDQDEFLEKRLNATRLGAAAFQRAGFSSVIPGLVDTGAGFFVDDPLFAYGRTTMQPSNLILGNPTIDLFMKGHGAATGISRSLFDSDYEYSQEDWRNTNSLFFFGNALGIRNINNLVGQDLPEQSTENY